jgi:hypothetical protein
MGTHVWRTIFPSYLPHVCVWLWSFLEKKLEMFSEDVRGILGEKIGRTFFYLGLFWNKKCGDLWRLLAYALMLAFKFFY